jgi:hypothetical protein
MKSFYDTGPPLPPNGAPARAKSRRGVPSNGFRSWAQLLPSGVEGQAPRRYHDAQGTLDVERLVGDVRRIEDALALTGGAK